MPQLLQQHNNDVRMLHLQHHKGLLHTAPWFGPGNPHCMAMVHAVMAPAKGRHPAERQCSITCLKHQPAEVLDIKTRMCAILHESANHPNCPMIVHEHHVPTDMAPTVHASTVIAKQATPMQTHHTSHVYTCIELTAAPLCPCAVWCTSTVHPTSVLL